MGLSQSIESKTRDLLTTQRLLDLKQKKRERDITQSMQLAATRDRLLWIGGTCRVAVHTAAHTSQGLHVRTT